MRAALFELAMTLHSRCSRRCGSGRTTTMTMNKWPFQVKYSTKINRSIAADVSVHAALRCSAFLCFTSYRYWNTFDLRKSFFFFRRLGVGRWRVASSDELHWLARAETDLHRALCFKNPGGLVSYFWWDWCLCYTCVVFRPGELTPAQPGKSFFHQGLQRGRKPPAGPGSLSDSCKTLPCLRPCYWRTHRWGPRGVRVYISRGRPDVNSRGRRVWCCQSKAVEGPQVKSLFDVGKNI